jgi:hypothetical protein
MWIPDVEPNPAKLAKILDPVIPERSRWFNLVTEIANALRVIERLWYRYPDEMSQIAVRRRTMDDRDLDDGIPQLNLDNNNIIAHWVAGKYGSDCLTDLEKEMIRRIKADFDVALKLENSTSTLWRISRRIVSHPQFRKMVWKLYTILDLKLPEDELAGKRSWEELYPEDVTHDGLPDDIDTERFQKCFEAMLDECIRRPLSEDEVYARFVNRYFSQEAVANPDREPLREIMNQLTEHPKWSKHVKKAYAGDHNAAAKEIAKFWGEACLKSNYTVSVERFVHTYTSLRLAELAEEDQTTSAACLRKIGNQE